jgi:outer membrane lipoprotein LolB
MILSLRRTALGSAALLLSACSTLHGTVPAGAEDEAAWHRHQTQLTALGDWRLSGRVGFVNGKDSGSGSLDWSQQAGIATLDFHGPLGAGAVHIEGDASALHVKTSRGDDFVTTDPETDLGERLHQPLPVLSLRYWVLGLPDPEADFVKVSDASGELESLDQLGWHMEYQEYATVAGFSLPVRLMLQRGEVHIKIAVSDWTLPAHEP